MKPVKSVREGKENETTGRNISMKGLLQINIFENPFRTQKKCACEQNGKRLLKAFKMNAVEKNLILFFNSEFCGLHDAATVRFLFSRVSLSRISGFFNWCETENVKIMWTNLLIERVRILDWFSKDFKEFFKSKIKKVASDFLGFLV